MRLTRILVPTDFSDASKAAARLASAIAARHDGSLTLLHVDRLPEFAQRMAERAAGNVLDAYLHERSVEIRRLLDELAATIGLRVGTAIARDEVPAAIVARAVSEKSDLVVLGSRGTGSRRAGLGSVAYEVSAHAPCPVLVARGVDVEAPPKAFKSALIAVATDRPFERAIALARALTAPGATIELAHVQSPAEELPAELARIRDESRAAFGARLDGAVATLRAEGVSARVHTQRSTDVAAALVDRVDRDGHDLIIVGQRPAPTASGMLGPIARRMLEDALVPVAVAR